MIETMILAAIVVNVFAVLTSFYFIYKLRNNHGNNYINSLAIALLISNIILITSFTLFYFEERKILPFFQFMTVPLGFSYGPLVFLYCKAVAKGQKQMRKKDYAHFFIFLVFTFVLILRFARSGINIYEFNDVQVMRYKDQFVVYMILVLFHWFSYLMMALTQLLNFRRQLKFDKSDHFRNIYLYMKIIQVCFVLILVLNGYCFLYHFSAKMILLISFIVSLSILSFAYIASQTPHIFWHYEVLKEHKKRRQTDWE